MADQRRRASDRLSSSGFPSGVPRLGLVVAIAGTVLAAVLWLAWRDAGVAGASVSQTPAWSADSQAIVYSAHQTGRPGDLFVVDVAVGEIESLGETAADERTPAVSPDGRQVAYERRLDGRSDIHVMRLDATGDRRLTSHPARDRTPAWSSDGTEIAFVSDRAAEGVFDIYVVGADGSNLRRLTTDGGYDAPAFAPDGRVLAAEHSGTIEGIDLDDGTAVPLLGGRSGRHPTWSPDGRLAFVGAEDDRDSLFVVDADGEIGLIVSVPSGGTVDPAWSPDGRIIAFVRVEDGDQPANDGDAAGGEIYIADLETGRLSRVGP